MILDHEDELEYETTKEEYETLHEDDSILETRGLYLTGIGDCTIVVNAKGGNTPHFEIHSNDNSFCTSIMLFEPKYYFRNNNNFSKLNDQQVDDLVKFLYETDYITTRYNWICQHWNNLNSLKKYKYYDHWQFADFNLLKEI